MVTRIPRRKPFDILKLMASSIQWSFNATTMGIIDVCRKVARERNARTVLRFAPKTSHQSNGFVEAVHGHMRDSHDATRHKLRRILAYNFQQFHLFFHLQFVTLDLCSQDSQCNLTAELHSNICLELQTYHFCACLVNLYSF